MHRVDHIRTRCDLESLVLEARLIRRHRPPYNRIGRGRTPTAWVRLTNELFPRLTIARTPSNAPAIGPLTTTAAEAVREALESAAPIRRCNERITKTTRFQACALAEMGRCSAPCEARIAPDDYARAAEPVRDAVEGRAAAALQRLDEHMQRLATAHRFEEAAGTRQRLGALVTALLRQRSVKALTDAGDITVDASGVRLDIASGGTLAMIDGAPLAVPPDGHPDEPRLIAAWLGRHRSVLRAASGVYAMPVDSGRALAGWRTRLSAASR
jgi:DNA polymerase-3 subunit epsilon